MNPPAPIEVLYLDEYFVAVNKPAGLLVIPSPRAERTTLLSLVNAQLADGQSGHLHPCHRLDRDTTGVTLFARGKKNQQSMMDGFKRRAVKKTYIALVHGTVKPSQGQFKRSIETVGYRGLNRSFPKIPALTEYRVLEQKKAYGIVEVRPITGRTNQIRIHFAQSGHPLVGERKFAFARDYDLKFRRTALHAVKLEFQHPVTHKNIIVSCELPSDMKDFITHN